jgi:hypothetical protein
MRIKVIVPPGLFVVRPAHNTVQIAGAGTGYLKRIRYGLQAGFSHSDLPDYAAHLFVIGARGVQVEIPVLDRRGTVFQAANRGQIIFQNTAADILDAPAVPDIGYPGFWGYFSDVSDFCPGWTT